MSIPIGFGSIVPLVLQDAFIKQSPIAWIEVLPPKQLDR